MRLRTRLFLAIGALVAIVVALVTWSVSAMARRAFEEADSARTAALIAQFRREFTREGEDVARRMDRIAAGEELRRGPPEPAGGATRALLVDVAAPLATAHDLDYLDVVAADGRIVSSAHWPARFGYQHPWVVPGRAPQRDAFMQVVESADGPALGVFALRLAHTAGGPLYLAGGRRIDREFLQALALPSGMRAMLYRNTGPEVSRGQLIDTSASVAQTTELEPLIARVRDTRSDASEMIVWPQGRELVHGIPLTGRDGAIVGVLLVVSPAFQLDALLTRIRWSALGLGAAGILMGGILSYVIAARVTRPVEELADAARTVASGDLTADVRVQASGELATLADAFGDMTRQLADHRERLLQAERVAAWRELARRLAHELKNPLFPLRLTLDNLQRAKTDHPSAFDEVFEEGMGTLRTGLSNLHTVIARFSDFARMPTPVFEATSLNDVVRQAGQLFEPRLHAPGQPPVTIALDLDESIGAVPLDAEQLGRALQNLLLNAIDAMPHGGTVRVRTRRAGSSIHLDVADTGEGLLDEERDRLFTPYYTTKQHGTGLGLAIVQSVVADHGGRIRVESRRGAGTTFHIELPASRPGADAS